MKKLFFILALSAATITSCNKIPIPPVVDPGQPGDPGPEMCEPVLGNVTPGILPGGCVVGFSIQNAWIEGDYLKVKVSYSGCNAHEFDMSWDMGIQPAGLTLQDMTGEQMCGAYFEQQLCFDLTNMRTDEHGYVPVNLDGFSGELYYKY